MTYLEAAHLILAEARKPLTEAEIVARAIKKGLILPRTKQPARSIGVVLKRASQNPSSSFESVAPHTWQLKPSKILEHPMSMREAALKILTLAGKPLHYEEITRRAIRAGLIRPEGKTPAYTLRARMGDDMQRNADSPFERTKDGTYGLHVWPKDLRKAKKAQAAAKAKAEAKAAKPATKKAAKVTAKAAAKATAKVAAKAAKLAAKEAKATLKLAKATAKAATKAVAKTKAEKPARQPKATVTELKTKIQKLPPTEPKVRRPRVKRAAIAETAGPVMAVKPRVKIADAESLARLAKNRAR